MKRILNIFFLLLAALINVEASAQSNGVLSVLLQDGSRRVQVYRVSNLDSRQSQLEASHQDKTILRKAWCERDTIYTEFGAYSLVIPKSYLVASSDNQSAVFTWKDHRTERHISEAGKIRALLSTYEVLCPNRVRTVLSELGAQPQQQQQDQQNTTIAAYGGRRVALVIGNARYRYAGALENPIRDAELLASTLRSTGFQSVTVKTDLTREQTITALRDFSRLADSADWAMVYFSGHGVEFGGVNYMIPIDAQLVTDRDIELEAINIGQLLNTVEGAKRLRLLVMDACRNNPFISQMRRTMASRSFGRGLARIEPEAGTLVVYAAKHGEVALDGEGKNSPFVDAMVKRIQQKPGLEVRRLFDFVRDDVIASTGRKQQPFSYGSISASEDFFFQR